MDLMEHQQLQAAPSTSCSDRERSPAGNSSSCSVELSEEQCRVFLKLMLAFGFGQAQWERLLTALSQHRTFRGVLRDTLVAHGQLLLRAIIEQEVRQRVPHFVLQGPGNRPLEPEQCLERLALLETLWDVFLIQPRPMHCGVLEALGWKDQSEFWTRSVLCFHLFSSSFGGWMPFWGGVGVLLDADRSPLRLGCILFFLFSALPFQQQRREYVHTYMYVAVVVRC